MSTIKVDTITDEAGTGAPDFPNGMTGSAASLTAIPAAQLTGTLPAIDGSALTGVDAFKPVAVTGTTPSLNVGTYNFFDNGTLSGDTTVTFASVPTEANWRYSFVADLLTTWDLSNASFLQSFSVATQEIQPTGVFFKPDGLKMYVMGINGDDVNEYDLSTAWDVSTAVYLQLFSVYAQENGPQSLFFKPDGLKMYVMGITGQDVNEYNLSTAWDVSTASFLQLFSVAGQETQPFGLFFKPDGTKMYVTGATGDDVNEYNLSTAWDVTTAVYLQKFSVAGAHTTPRGVFFKPDGLRMYVIGDTADQVTEYSLGTAWDLDSASYLQNFDVSAVGVGPQSLFFKPDGTKMYVADGGTDRIDEYDISTGTTLTLPASVQNPPTEDSSTGDRVTYEFYTLDGGTNVYIINEEVL